MLEWIESVPLQSLQSEIELELDKQLHKVRKVVP